MNLVGEAVEAILRYLATASVIAAVLTTAAWLFVRLYRIRAAIYRHTIWLYCLLGIAVVPPLWLYGPKLTLAILPARTVDMAPPVATTGTGAPSEPRLPLPKDYELDGTVLAPSARVEVPAQVSRPFPTKPVIAGVWLLGVLLMLTKLAIGCMRLRRICHRAEVAVDVKELLGSARTRMTILISSEVHGPVCAGLLRPVIILPRGMYEDSTQEEIRMVLSHEIAHVTRRDYITNLFQRLLEATFFFHPFVWYASRQLIHEREQVCDNWALARGADMQDYAELLSRLAERVCLGSSLQGVALFEGGLLRRVRSLLDPRRIKLTRLSWLAALLCALVAAISFSAFGILRLAQAQPKDTDHARKRGKYYDYSVMLAFYGDDSYRFPTEDELKELESLWPKVPPKENAAFYYAKAASLLATGKLMPAGSAMDPTRPYAGDQQALATWVEANRFALDTMAEVRDLKGCRFPVVVQGDNGSILSFAFPLLGRLQRLARICRDAAFLDELKGNPDEAAERHLACIRMGTSLRQGHGFMDSLVGMAICKDALADLHRLLANHRLRDTTLHGVITECRSAESRPDELARVWDNTGVQAEWLIARVDEKDWQESWEAGYPDARDGNRLKKIPAPNREEYLRSLPQAQVAVRQVLLRPLPELLAKNGGLDMLWSQARQRSSYPATVHLDMYDGHLGPWVTQLGRTDVNLRALKTRAAIALFVKRNGKLPARLDALGAESVHDAPLDPFSSKAMRFTKVGDGWKLWSVGHDGVDNGGKGDPDAIWKGPDYVYPSRLRSNLEERSKPQRSQSAAGAARGTNTAAPLDGNQDDGAAAKADGHEQARETGDQEPSDTQGVGAISGIVRDCDGRPVAGARVEAILRDDRFEPQVGRRLVAAETTTDRDGAYRLPALPTGRPVLIFVSHPEWADGGSHGAPLEEGEQRARVDIEVVEPEPLSGMVSDEGGQPIAGATVFLWGGAPRAGAGRVRDGARRGVHIHAARYGGLARTKTSPDGTFRFSRLPKGWLLVGLGAAGDGYGTNYAYSIEAHRRAWRDLAADVPTAWSALDIPPPWPRVQIVLKKGGSVTGRVVRADSGEPVPEALVSVAGAMGEPGLWLSSVSYECHTRADASGRYQVADLPPTWLNVQARCGALVSQVRRVNVLSGKAVRELTLEMYEAGAIEGRVYDAGSNRPLPDQGVHHMHTGVSGALPGTASGQNGHFRCKGLQFGRWQVWPANGMWQLNKSRHPDADDWGLKVTVKAGQTTRGVDLYLEKRPPREAGRIVGRVCDAAGKLVVGARVLALERTLHVTTDQRGEYALAGLRPGTCYLRAVDDATLKFGRTTVKVEIGQTAVVDLRTVHKAARVSGSILGENGQPVNFPVRLRVNRSWQPSILVPARSRAYTTRAIEPGTCSISVEHVSDYGYQATPDCIGLRLEGGDDVTGQDFVLRRITSVVAGIAVRPDGAPVTHTEVCAGMKRGTARGQTDHRGQFRLLAEDPGYLRVGTPGGPPDWGDPEWAHLDPVPEPADRLRIVLHPVGVLKGQLVLPVGGLPELSVTASGKLGFDWWQTSRDLEDGCFELRLQPDTYQVAVRHRGGARTLKDIAVRPGETTDLGEIDCSQVPTGTGTIHGRITFEGQLSSRLERWYEMKLYPAAGGPPIRTIHAEGHQASYRAERLAPGSYHVVAKVLLVKSVWVMHREVEVADDAEVEADFTFPLGRAGIAGSVSLPPGWDPEAQDEQGSVIVGVFLFDPGACPFRAGQTHPLSAPPRGLRSPAELRHKGTFYFQWVPAGTYDVVATMTRTTTDAGPGETSATTVVRVDSKRVTVLDRAHAHVKLDLRD